MKVQNRDNEKNELGSKILSGLVWTYLERTLAQSVTFIWRRGILSTLEKFFRGDGDNFIGGRHCRILFESSRLQNFNETHFRDARD